MALSQALGHTNSSMPNFVLLLQSVGYTKSNVSKLPFIGSTFRHTNSNIPKEYGISLPILVYLGHTKSISCNICICILKM